jgi:hypothetical protein
MTSDRFLWVVALAGSGLLGACGGGSEPAPPPADSPAESSAAASVAKGDFGVPECDEYMKKYIACIESRVPEAGRAVLKQSLEQQKAAWKQAAATPEGRRGLAMGCTAAAEHAKTAVQAYGCAW